MRCSPTRTCKICTEFTAERHCWRGEVQFMSIEKRKRNKVTSCSHSLLIINPSSWWSEIQDWCITKGQVLFNLHANYLGATVVTEKSPLHLLLTLVFLISSKTDLKNVTPLFHTGRACFMLFFDRLTTFPFPFSRLFMMQVQLLMVFTWASSQDPVRVWMCSDRKPFKTVDLGTPQQHWCVSKQDERAVHGICWVHHWEFPFLLMLSSLGLISEQLRCHQFVSSCYCFSAQITTHPLSGHLRFQNLYLASCLRTLKYLSPEWSPVGDFLLSDIPLTFCKDYLSRMSSLTISFTFSLNSFICANSKCLKKIVSPRYIKHTYLFIV